MIKQWSPRLDYLAHEIGIPCTMILREDYLGMLDALEHGEIDIAEGGPRTSTAAIDRGSARSLVRIRRFNPDEFRIVILASARSNIWQLQDLLAKRFALVDELSTFGYLFPRITLHEAGVVDPETFFRQIFLMGSHERSIDAVLDGITDGAAVLHFFYHQLDPRQRAQLRIIHQSPPVSSETDELLIRSGVEDALQEKIRAALLRYHEQVPIETRRAIMIEQFLPPKVGDDAYSEIRAALALNQSLPKLTYLIPYQQTPTMIAKRIDITKRHALLYLSGIFVLGLFALVMGVIAFRQRLSSVVGWSITSIVGILMGAFSAIQLLALFSAIDTFAYQTIVKLENLNLRLSAASTEPSIEALDHILQVATHASPIQYANLLRNGRIMAASRPQDRGTSIIARIRSRTFASTDPNIVQIIDPIIIERQRFASLQIGVSVTPLHQLVQRTVAINGVVIAVAISLSIGGLFTIRRKFATRFAAITSVVNQLREGGVAYLDTPDATLRPLAQSFHLLSRELAEKEELLVMAQQDATDASTAHDPAMTQELIARFESMETHNEAFRRLRHTEAFGNSPAWLRCLRDAAIRSKDREPVVILGPSGSGKTSVARIIHALSPRRTHSLGEFNCAELASADPLVVLGKLFGYGARSGITDIERTGQPGILEAHHGSSLFLDEVGILPMQAQELLLLPLEGRSFNPAAGQGAPKQVDVRFIFATNESLETLVTKGKMRHDLLRRIQGRGAIHVPPLTQRPEDIELLAQHFLADLNARHGTRCDFHPDTMARLTQHTYAQYNISELRGVIQQAFDRAGFEDRQQITPAHLPGALLHTQHETPLEEQTAVRFDLDELRMLQILRAHDFNITRAEAQLGYAAGSKTLTNRLRGLVYKIVALTQGNLEQSVRALIGERTDCRAKVMLRVTHYLEALKRNREQKDTTKLLTNLPQKYHGHLQTALDLA